jgi:hypothetical protein
MSEEIGRILRANTTGFAFGCRVNQLQHPRFGGLVRVETGSEAIYGLIWNINVDDDPLVRRLIMAETLTRNIVDDQRQNRLLPVEMQVLALGFSADGTLTHGFPPRPPLNLDPVFNVDDPAEAIRFSDTPHYLRLILRAEGIGVPVDQLLVAHIRALYHLRGRDEAWLHQVIGEVIELLRSNYDVLVPTLEALSQALPTVAHIVPKEGWQ